MEIAPGAMVEAPRWAAQIKQQARALAGYLLCLIGFLFMPMAIAELHKSWADVEWTARHTYTVQFSAMPEAYRTGAGFDLAIAERRAKVQCVRLGPAGEPTQLPLYQCQAVQLNPQSNLSARHDFFPAEQGWVLIDRRDTDFKLESPTLDDAGWWGLFTLLAAALYWRGRRFVHERTKCSALMGLGWCALVVVGVYFIDEALMPWREATDVPTIDYALLSLVTVVVVGPLLEELVFRGIGWRLLRPAFPLWMVVLVTSVTFALAHNVTWNGQLTILASGLALAWLRNRTGSVGWCFAAHAAMNALALASNYQY